MALKDQLVRWLRRKLLPGSNALNIHDALEATFTELDGDVAAMDGDTVIDTARSAALDRWGTDLAEPRLPGQTDEQYAANLKAVKQGKAINEAGIRYALDKWGLTYRLLEFGDASTFWDSGFYDNTAVSIPARQIDILFADPFAGITPTSDQVAAAKQALSNAVRDANRVKARGVKIVPIVPVSLS
jgi:hypothetical protein